MVERLWDGTVARARRLDPDLLHESVDGEWSFIETLRHLVFATDSWIRRAILGDPAPGSAGPPVGRCLTRRASPRPRRPRRWTKCSSYAGTDGHRAGGIDGLTVETLASTTEPVEGPGWPEPRGYPVTQCLLCILNEEWEHRLYAERDLDVRAAPS